MIDQKYSINLDWPKKWCSTGVQDVCDD